MGAFAPGRLVRLARKELTEILRDRRTIVTLVVMPLVLYPLLTIGFGRLDFSHKAVQQAPKYKIGYPAGAENEKWARKYLETNMPHGRDQPEHLLAGPFDDLDEAVRTEQVHVGIRPR